MRWPVDRRYCPVCKCTVERHEKCLCKWNEREQKGEEE